MSPALLSALLLTTLAWTGADVGAFTKPLRQQDLPALSGSVRSDGDVGLLVGAVVEVRQGIRLYRERADEAGTYRFEGLEPGPADLSVFHFSALPLGVRVVLPGRGEVRLDLLLQHRVIPVAGLHVRGVPEPELAAHADGSSERARVAFGLRSLDASSGLAESGLASTVSPDDPGDTGGVLYTRGSTVDARLVLLDGAPILTPFHVAGLVAPFDLRLLDTAELYLGGAPSPYSGGVSYLLDVETRPARRDRPRVTVGADGLTLDAVVEAPLPLDGSVLAGGRLLHGLQESIGGPDRFPYGYHDLLLRMGLSPGEGHEFRVTAFENREGVRLDLGVNSPHAGDRAVWGNRALSARYGGRLGAVELNAIAAASRYDSKLPVSWVEPVLASGIGDRARFGGEGSVPAGSGSLRVGASIERSTFRYDLLDLSVAQSSSLEPGALALGTTEVGMFGEWDGLVSPGLGLRAGIRADQYSHEGRLRLSPRVALRLALGERVDLFTRLGRYHQVLPAPGLRARGGTDGEPPSLGWNPSLPVASATHFVVGLEQELDRQIYLSLTAFAKTFSGLGEGADDRSRSSGTELRVSREGDRLRGWFGYALSWFWVDEGPAGSTRFDGRHLLSLGLEGTVPGGIELTGSLGFGAGLPMTAVGLPSEGAGQAPAAFGDAQGALSERALNQSGGGAPLGLAPEGDFLRMDFEVAWPITARIGGRSTELRPYVKILNALDRRDALFYYFDQWHEEEARPLATRPLMPLVGFRWRL